MVDPEDSDVDSEGHNLEQRDIKNGISKEERAEWEAIEPDLHMNYDARDCEPPDFTDSDEEEVVVAEAVGDPV